MGNNKSMHAIYGVTKDCNRFFYHQGVSEEEALQNVFLWIKEEHIKNEDLELFYILHVDIEDRIGRASFESLSLEGDNTIVISPEREGDDYVHKIEASLAENRRLWKTVKTGSRLSRASARKGIARRVIEKNGCRYTIALGELTA